MINSITKNLDLWVAAQVNKKAIGRGSNKKKEAYGIKKLRELILDLAVRGKLVPQDLNDEAANVLLEEITEEKLRLIKEKKIKKPKKFSQITDDEMPFELPYSWEWARLNDVGHDWGQKKPEDNFTYIEVSAIDNTIGAVKDPSILRASDAPSRARKIVKVGTVIYSTVRPYLQNICVIELNYAPEPIASTAFAILHPFLEMPGKYFALYLRSPEFVKYVESVQTGIAYPAINDKQFFGGLVPIPPLAEQQRIVAKVDELMVLCDQLEHQQTNSATSHQTLVETLLGTLTSVESQDKFTEAWNRIANHFDTLFTTEESIDQLKQTVLQLAVMGKLVAQNPNDEPASVLLKKIDEEKQRLIIEGKIRKQKSLPKISEDEISFTLPKGWKWVRLNNVIDVRDGTHDSPKNSNETESFPLITSKDFHDGGINFKNARRISAEDHMEISKRSLVEVEDILFSMIGGNIGNQVMVFDKRPFSIKNVALFKYYSNRLTFPYFIKKYLENLAYTLQQSASGGAQPFVSLGALRKLVIAMPPEVEQRRIVAKVDELMTICDALKTHINDAQTTKIHLADAIVEQAVA